MILDKFLTAPNVNVIWMCMRSVICLRRVTSVLPSALKTFVKFGLLSDLAKYVGLGTHTYTCAANWQ